MRDRRRIEIEAARAELRAGLRADVARWPHLRGSLPPDATDNDLADALGIERDGDERDGEGGAS